MQKIIHHLDSQESTNTNYKGKPPHTSENGLQPTPKKEQTQAKLSGLQLERNLHSLLLGKLLGTPTM